MSYDYDKKDGDKKEDGDHYYKYYDFSEDNEAAIVQYGNIEQNIDQENTQNNVLMIDDSTFTGGAGGTGGMGGTGGGGGTGGVGGDGGSGLVFAPVNTNTQTATNTATLDQDQVAAVLQDFEADDFALIGFNELALVFPEDFA